MKSKVTAAAILSLAIVGGAAIVGYFFYKGSAEPSQQAAPSPTPPIEESKTSPTPGPALEVVSSLEPSPEPSPSANPLNPEDPMESYLATLKDDESIRDELYRLYGRFNGLVGNYDNYKTTSQEEWRELLDYNFLQPEVYEKFAEVTSSEELGKDFANVASLVDCAREGLADGEPSEDDIQALRYAYEIVNDVQTWILPQGAEDTKMRHRFGASFALEGHKEADAIDGWLAEKE
ncbi:hypothetical protein J19TS2_26010 [Cohnella xylanilytica]|uniref:hypothetical protein n=1 Tax=Cohnella xylanilytica TaxID=557555 RepID=UPI001B1A6F07|nr:hypothetical protein [Cohnella xylanilytica]GIO13046.1 hypothetical protein J19TS2_26010 [Cohnella xylanilytica]